jgi:hypothetical protein
MPRAMPRVEQAAHYVAQGMTPAQAAKKLGYATSSAFLSHSSYKSTLAVLQAENDQMSRLKRQDVQDIVMEAIQMARLGSDPMTMIRGAQELNKMNGYYAPEEKKMTLNISQRRIQEQYDSMSDEELLILASKTETVIIEDAEIIEIDSERPVDDPEE